MNDEQVPVIKKALAYITHHNKLLVFEHPLSPEAGIQVPAGTVKSGESPEDAMMREAQEETGLSIFKRGAFLGDYLKDMSEFGKQETHHRFFYHLTCTQEPPETWRYGEYDPSETDADYIPFDFYWVDLLDDVPNLAGEQGKMINKLLDYLSNIV